MGRLRAAGTRLSIAVPVGLLSLLLTPCAVAARDANGISCDVVDPDTQACAVEMILCRKPRKKNDRFTPRLVQRGADCPSGEERQPYTADISLATPPDPGSLRVFDGLGRDLGAFTGRMIFPTAPHFGRNVRRPHFTTVLVHSGFQVALLPSGLLPLPTEEGFVWLEFTGQACSGTGVVDAALANHVISNPRSPTGLSVGSRTTYLPTVTVQSAFSPEFGCTLFPPKERFSKVPVAPIDPDAVGLPQPLVPPIWVGRWEPDE